VGHVSMVGSSGRGCAERGLPGVVSVGGVGVTSMTGSGKPKLLLVQSGPAPEEVVAPALAEAFEVVVVTPDELRPGNPAAIAAMGSAQYVLCEIGEASSIVGALPVGHASAALSSIGEGVCLSTVEGQITWCNDRFKAYDEQTRARIAAVCRRAAQQFEDQLVNQEAPGYAPGGRFEVASPDESRFYEVVVSPVRRPSPSGVGPGRLERVAAVVMDVTASRRMQQKMDAIDRAGTELCRLDADAVRKKHVAERLKLLEDKIVRYCHELLRFDHLAIRLIDERTGRLELVMSRGLPPEAMEIELYAQREGNGIMGYVAATGRSYLCPDVTKDRRYVMGLHGARSSLTVPLRLNDKVIGAFNVESELLAAFTEEDRQFAEMFATHMALALHILDLLVVERCTTGETVTGTVQVELNEPLDDIMAEAQWLRQAAATDPNLREHVDKIIADVSAIRQRVREAAGGPQNILGADKVLAGLQTDPALAGKHVLVADDEPKIRQIIREILRGKGCRVAICSDGAGAIAELEASQAAGEFGRFDLVISDIKMPDRNGYEVFAAARRVDRTLPVILMTGFGYDPHHSIVRASQEGLQCVLFKPFQIERLLDEVKKALGVPAVRA
jgi:two-component system, sensor histidine kinase SagS